MSSMDEQALLGTLFDDSTLLSVEELSRLCAVDEHHIVQYVEEGVLTTIGVTQEWRFSGSALRRARIAVRLQRDLDLNLPGVALALDLLEEIEQLRREIKARG